MTDQPQEPRDSSFLVVIALGIIAGVVLGEPLYGFKRESGLLVVFVVPLLFVACWGVANWLRRAMSKDAEAQESRRIRRRSRLWLAFVSLLISSLGTAIVSMVYVFAFDVAEQDRAYEVVAISTIGFLAGLIVAAAIGLSAIFE